MNKLLTDEEGNNSNRVLRWNDGNPNKLQHMILDQRGTLRLYLSALFKSEVIVEVTNQIETVNSIIRNVVLTTHNENGERIDVCMATSVISTVSDNPINYQFVKLIHGRKMGIGDILYRLGIKMDINVTNIVGGNELFSRIYTMENQVHGISIVITETFPCSLYQNESLIV